MKVYLCNEFKSDINHISHRLYRDLVSLYYLMGIDVVTSNEQNFDFAHFVDMSKKNEIIYVKERLKKKVIVNYFVNKKLTRTDGISDIVISFEEKRVLNRVDLVIVSCQADKMILIANEIKTPIEIMTPPIKEERFTNISELEKNSFYQYAGIVKNEQFALSVVNLKNYQDVFDLVELARKLSDLRFFVFGPKIKIRTAGRIKKLIKTAPRNFIYKSYLNEDLFKSAMLHSKFFIVTRETEGELLTILEAMITKTQIFTFNTHLTGDVLIDNINCILSINAEDMGNQITKYLDNNISTTEEAYLFAKECDYSKCSLQLKSILENYIGFNKKN